MLPGLIMDMPLMISSAIEHAATFHGGTEILARDVDGAIHRYTYAEAHRRAKRLANALGRLGVQRGDRIGTLGWNTHRHFELFYGVSGSGAVLHPVNPRLFVDQIVYIINHAEDTWLFIDAVTLPLAEQLAPRLKSVKGFVLMGARAAMPADTTLAPLLCYEELLAAESDDYVWPHFDERSASSICYTSGTTGDPKGVVYSHRSSVLVAMLFTEWVYRGGRNGAAETLMSLAPLFNANGWYFPYTAPDAVPPARGLFGRHRRAAHALRQVRGLGHRAGRFRTMASPSAISAPSRRGSPPVTSRERAPRWMPPSIRDGRSGRC